MSLQSRCWPWIQASEGLPKVKVSASMLACVAVGRRLDRFLCLSSHRCKMETIIVASLGYWTVLRKQNGLYQLTHAMTPKYYSCLPIIYIQ